MVWSWPLPPPKISNLQIERTFSLADLAAFAELSGDFNPLHTDPVAARRTQFGECVAHGIFVLLWALDGWQTHSGSFRRWQKISAKFLRPVPANLKVTALAKPKDADEISLVVSASGQTLLQCQLTWSEAGLDTNGGTTPRDEIPPHEIPAQPEIKISPIAREPLDLFCSRNLGKRLFPKLAETQRPDSLAVLLASTRVIGMKVPGKDSVFMQIDMEFAPHSDIAAPFTYRVAEYRRSSQRLGIAIAGSAGCGTLWALVRPAPVTQVGMAVVRQRIRPDRFRGRRVIVVGGSRGLGEIAAKLLAAGGAEVALSYRLGGDDANRVVADICAHGGKAFVFQLDTVSTDWEKSLMANCPHFNHLCYFPTPPIVGGDGSTFNSELFAKFCGVYVAGFVNVAQWLAKQNAGLFCLFNASTIYVETPPLRNLEYAAAKAASETCCRWLAAAYPKARVYAARFPRLNTDQTASFLSAGEHDNLETMLAELSAWLPA